MKKPIARTLNGVRVAALSVAALSPALHAQTVASDDIVVLDEVVVTARKREESLRDVPLTVTAVTADAIERLGIRDAYDRRDPSTEDRAVDRRRSTGDMWSRRP